MEPKKNPKYDLESKRPLFLSIGFLLSMLFVTAAFNWKSEYTKVVIEPNRDIFDELPTVYITEIEPPKPVVKEKKKTEIVKKELVKIVPTNKELETIIDAIDEPVDEPFIDLPIDDLPPEPYVEKVHDIVESMPEFPGGMEAFYRAISKEIKYPKQAKRINMEGKVYVQFVIDTDGSITEINTIKGIGVGCDEEAERVLGLLPNFVPGKQRGRPVKVRMILPITFRLN